MTFLFLCSTFTTQILPKDLSFKDMKAVQINKYGGSDVLEINDIQEPSPTSGQILVEVYDASINPIDLKIRAGYLKDAVKILPVTLGTDFSGVVSKVGETVFGLNKGDEVYGNAIFLGGGSGTFAEFVAANITSAALKPKSVKFEEAGALPLAGASAIQALEEQIKLQSGQKILIHGGAGGIGHIAVQLAKALGSYVATTVSADDIEFVKELGADEAIDYKNESFKDRLKDYDAVFDTVGADTTEKSFKVLKKGGVIVSMLGAPNPQLAKQHGVIAVGQATETNTKRLNRLTELVDSGKVKVHIDKVFPLEKVRQAFNHQEKGHPRGKVVLRIKS